MKIFTNTIGNLEDSPDTRIEGLVIRLRSASEDSFNGLEQCLKTLKAAPAKQMGYVELIVPLDQNREGRWRLPGKIGLDSSVQAAIKATKLVETLEEIIV